MAWAICEPGILDPAASRDLAASLPLNSRHLTDATVYIYIAVGSCRLWRVDESILLRSERRLLSSDTFQVPAVLTPFREMTKHVDTTSFAEGTSMSANFKTGVVTRRQVSALTEMLQ